LLVSCSPQASKPLFCLFSSSNPKVGRLSSIAASQHRSIPVIFSFMHASTNRPDYEARPDDLLALPEKYTQSTTNNASIHPRI
jgi:hypothetical protein